MRHWRILEYFLPPTPPLHTRRCLKRNMAATTPSQVDGNDDINEGLLKLRFAQSHIKSQEWEIKSNPYLLHAFSPVYRFTFLLCVFGPKANNLWHKLSSDTLKNVDTSNREWGVGKKLNLKPKLIEVSQNLTLLEESLL